MMKIFLKISAVVLSLLLVFTLNNRLLLSIYNSSALYGSFTQKMKRAETIDTEKVIIIGGSASNLGFDSKTFESLSGKPCANLSVSAGVPLRVYMKAAELCAKSGDIVIMPLEYNYYNGDFHGISEAYVDMVGVDKSLRCNDDFYHSIEYGVSSFLRSFTRINDCILFALRDKMNTQNTIYIADSVDEYGDFCLHKDRAPTYKRTIENLEFEYNEENLMEILRFIEKMSQKGVEVFLTYPATDIYRISSYQQYADDAREAVENYIPVKHIIGTPMDFAYEEAFFFDTAYHLQHKYRSAYTEKLYSLYKNATK